ncbi:MAG: DUF3617 family protein [Alphaproteobacteria bacterium]|nr:MAG: DUF3617 family protein [Alphaproteobacteria bacterium]
MRAPAGARDGRKPMLKAALLAGAVLALAACGGDKGESARKSEVAGGANASGTASASAAAAPAASPGSPAQRMQLDPGQWEITVQTKMSGKGMPPEVASAMAMNKVDGSVFAGKEEGGCTAKDMAIEGGRVRGTMTCKGQNGTGAMTMTMDGQYSGTSFDIRNKMDISGQGMAGMTVEAHSVGKRVGDCPAGAG